MAITAFGRIYWRDEFASSDVEVVVKANLKLARLAIAEIVFSAIAAIAALVLACDYKDLPNDFFISQDDLYIAMGSFVGNSLISTIFKLHAHIQTINTRLLATEEELGRKNKELNAAIKFKDKEYGEEWFKKLNDNLNAEVRALNKKLQSQPEDFAKEGHKMNQRHQDIIDGITQRSETKIAELEQQVSLLQSQLNGKS